jgi:hypothetical protein
MTNLTRQLTTTVEPKIQRKKLLQSLRFWSWGRLLKIADNNACFISEYDFIDLMKKEIDGLKIPCIERGDAIASIKKNGYKCAIVLVKKDEAKLVKSIRSQFPDMEVYSTLYDIIPGNPRHPFNLPDIQLNYKEKPLLETFKNTTLVISSPESDCEYFLQSLEENGFGKAPHIFNKPFKNMIEYSGHFQVSRFLKSAQLYQECDEHMFIHLQSDVLNQMLFRSNFSYKQFRKFIGKAGIKVIYFCRRDKLAQTAIQALMSNRNMRSIWHMPPQQKATFCNNRKVNNELAWRSMLENMDTEARLESFFNKLPTVKMITLEEFRDANETVMANLARFLEVKAPETIKTISYDTPYEEITGLVERITEFKRSMIDRMGLHINSKGSLSTENEAYFKDRK